MAGCLAVALSPALNAADELPPEEAEETGTDIMSMDVGGSILDAVNRRGLVHFGIDVRGSFSWSDFELDDGESDRDDEFVSRIRVNGTWNPFESLRLTGRVALACSDDSCDLELAFEPGVAGNSVDSGIVTLDELFLQWFRTERFNLAAGRLQTKFVTRGGVFAKSLDRNNSNNSSINWTDGIHGTLTGKGWIAHLILEYNNEDGPGSIRRSPLDFSTSNSEITRFIAFENTRPLGYIVHRGIDISYLPDSLLKDGGPMGRREDYWGIVARVVARFPLGTYNRRVAVGGEVGYAPKTPTRVAAGTGTRGDTDGLAWNLSMSLMDIVPGHSIGVLYGRTESGWLLSPQFGSNEEQIEVRWSWRIEDSLTVDARIRHREDLHRQLSAKGKHRNLDAFVRATWQFSRSRS